MAARRRSVLKLLMNRRSIRIFRPAEMPEEILELLVQAGQRAPTYLQAYTIIHVKDSRKREEVAKLCHEGIVKNASAVLIVCADLYRPALMLDLLGHKHVLQTDRHPVEAVFAVFDAALVAENIIIAAEALGYGSVILDCPLLEAQKFAELFDLPKGVVPIALLCIGERAETPPPRPRLPLNQILHVDTYEEPSSEELERFLKELEKHMERENYVRKYAEMDVRYLEYLKLKTELNDEARKLNDAVAKYLRDNFLKL